MKNLLLSTMLLFAFAVPAYAQSLPPAYATEVPTQAVITPQVGTDIFATDVAQQQADMQANTFWLNNDLVYCDPDEDECMFYPQGAQLPGNTFVMTAQSAPLEVGESLPLEDSLLFWAILIALMFVVVLLGGSLVVWFSRWIASIENKIPDAALPFYEAGKQAVLPVVYTQGEQARQRGMQWAERYAERTATPYDDELVEIIDNVGRKHLVKIVRTLGYEPDTTGNND